MAVFTFALHLCLQVTAASHWLLAGIQSLDLYFIPLIE